ncbi:hypothetical protein F66182_8413 [Fusarium sp. NRRL 66182]|nr:hypothetical protein F66182_8413 [Fusarium sp. NRRL 66182]
MQRDNRSRDSESSRRRQYESRDRDSRDQGDSRQPPRPAQQSLPQEQPQFYQQQYQQPYQQRQYDPQTYQQSPMYQQPQQYPQFPPPSQYYQQQQPYSNAPPQSMPAFNGSYQPHPNAQRPQTPSSIFSSSSDSSSLLDISRYKDTKEYGGVFGTFFKAPSDRIKQRLHKKKQKKRRVLYFGNSSSSSVNSDLAYGQGYIKQAKSRTLSPRSRGSGQGSAPASAYGPGHAQRRRSSGGSDRTPRPTPQKKTADEEIMALGQQLSDLARRSKEDEQRQASKGSGKGKAAALALAAGAAGAAMASRHGRKQRDSRKTSSSKHRVTSSDDDSDWEDASDDESSSSDDARSAADSELAYGTVGESTKPAVVAAAATGSAAAAAVMANSQRHSSYGSTSEYGRYGERGSIVDPRRFGPYNSLRGSIHTPCGFQDEEQASAYRRNSGQPQPGGPIQMRDVYQAPTFDPSRSDTGRFSASASHQDSSARPAPVPLQQPVPKIPVSSKVYNTEKLENVNHKERHRSERSDEKSWSGAATAGVAAAAAVGAAMASSSSMRKDSHEYRMDEKRDRDDRERQELERIGLQRQRALEAEQAKLEELERQKAQELARQRAQDPEHRKNEWKRQLAQFTERHQTLENERRRNVQWEREYRGSEPVPIFPKYNDERKSSRYDDHDDTPKDEKESNEKREVEVVAASEGGAFRIEHGPEFEVMSEPVTQSQSSERNVMQKGRELPVPTGAGHQAVAEPTRSTDPAIDPFQYQVSDDAFTMSQTTTPGRPLTPNVVTIEREPNFDDSPPRTSAADARLSRRDSFEIECMAEEYRREAQGTSHYRDPRAGHEYEEEEHKAKSILDEAKHATVPVAAAAFASAVAVEHERSQERRTSQYSKDRSKPRKDVVQEEADRYYREACIARKIASDELRSRSASPERSVVDKWQDYTRQEDKDEPFTIITPPTMEDKHPEKNMFEGPDADVRIDNKIYPREERHFRNLGDKSTALVLRTREASRERPVLNLIYPTPGSSRQHTPAPEERKTRQAAQEPSIPEDVAIGPKGEIVSTSEPVSVAKSVSWGENETKSFEVDTPDHRSDADNYFPTDKSSDKTRPKLNKTSRWGILAAALAGSGAEPPNEPPVAVPSQTDSDIPKSFSAEASRDISVHSADTLDDDATREPPVPGPKPASPHPPQMPGGYADDLEFAATLAAGLKDTGFNPDIVIDDPSYSRRDSPPGVQEAIGDSSHDDTNGTAWYKRPYPEVVSGPSDVNAPTLLPEQGFVVGEIETPQEKTTTSYEGEYDIKPDWHQQDVLALNNTSNIVKREQRRRDKSDVVVVQDDGKIETVQAEPSLSREVGEQVWEDTSRKRGKKDRKNREFDDDRSPGVSVHDHYYNASPSRDVPTSNARSDFDWSTSRDEGHSRGFDAADIAKVVAPALAIGALTSSRDTPSRDLGSDDERDTPKKSRKHRDHDYYYDDDRSRDSVPEKSSYQRHSSRDVSSRDLRSDDEWEDSKRSRKHRKDRDSRDDDKYRISATLDPNDRRSSKRGSSRDRSRDRSRDKSRDRRDKLRDRSGDRRDRSRERSRRRGIEEEKPKKSKRDSYGYESPTRSLAASEVSVGSSSNKRNKKSKRRSGTEEDFDSPRDSPLDHKRDFFDNRDVSSVVSESRGDDRRRESSHRRKSSRYDDDDAKSTTSMPGSSRREKEYKDRRTPEKRPSSSVLSSLFKSRKDKKDSFLDNADTLGAGVGLAGAAAIIPSDATRSNAAEAPSLPEHDVSHDIRRVRSYEIVDPEVVPRVIKPAIDPQYGDLLPLPPSAPASPTSGPEDLPPLPDSRPDTPPEERAIRRTPWTHQRRRSAFETPTKSPSRTAVPIQLRLGNRSNPGSPVSFRASPASSPITSYSDAAAMSRRAARPTSWDSSREIMPLYLLEHARHAQPTTGSALPALPPSEASEASSRNSPELESESYQRSDDYFGPELDYIDSALHIDTGLSESLPKDAIAESEQTTPRAEFMPVLSAPSAAEALSDEPAKEPSTPQPMPVEPTSKDMESDLYSPLSSHSPLPFEHASASVAAPAALAASALAWDKERNELPAENTADHAPINEHSSDVVGDHSEGNISAEDIPKSPTAGLDTESAPETNLQSRNEPLIGPIVTPVKDSTTEDHINVMQPVVEEAFELAKEHAPETTTDNVEESHLSPIIESPVDYALPVIVPVYQDTFRDFIAEPIHEDVTTLTTEPAPQPSDESAAEPTAEIVPEIVEPSDTPTAEDDGIYREIPRSNVEPDSMTFLETINEDVTDSTPTAESASQPFAGSTEETAEPSPREAEPVVVTPTPDVVVEPRPEPAAAGAPNMSTPVLLEGIDEKQSDPSPQRAENEITTEEWENMNSKDRKNLKKKLKKKGLEPVIQDSFNIPVPAGEASNDDQITQNEEPAAKEEPSETKQAAPKAEESAESTAQPVIETFVAPVLVDVTEPEVSEKELPTATGDEDSSKPEGEILSTRLEPVIMHETESTPKETEDVNELAVPTPAVSATEPSAEAETVAAEDTPRSRVRDAIKAIEQPPESPTKSKKKKKKGKAQQTADDLPTLAEIAVTEPEALAPEADVDPFDAWAEPDAAVVEPSSKTPAEPYKAIAEGTQDIPAGPAEPTVEAPAEPHVGADAFDDWAQLDTPVEDVYTSEPAPDKSLAPSQPTLEPATESTQLDDTTASKSKKKKKKKKGTKSEEEPATDIQNVPVQDEPFPVTEDHVKNFSEDVTRGSANQTSVPPAEAGSEPTNATQEKEAIVSQPIGFPAKEKTAKSKDDGAARFRSSNGLFASGGMSAIGSAFRKMWGSHDQPMGSLPSSAASQSNTAQTEARPYPESAIVEKTEIVESKPDVPTTSLDEVAPASSVVPTKFESHVSEPLFSQGDASTNPSQAASIELELSQVDEPVTAIEDTSRDAQLQVAHATESQPSEIIQEDTKESSDAKLDQIVEEDITNTIEAEEDKPTEQVTEISEADTLGSKKKAKKSKKKKQNQASQEIYDDEIKDETKQDEVTKEHTREQDTPRAMEAITETLNVQPTDETLRYAEVESKSEEKPQTWESPQIEEKSAQPEQMLQTEEQPIGTEQKPQPEEKVAELESKSKIEETQAGVEKRPQLEEKPAEVETSVELQQTPQIEGKLIEVEKPNEVGEKPSEIEEAPPSEEKLADVKETQSEENVAETEEPTELGDKPQTEQTLTDAEGAQSEAKQAELGHKPQTEEKLTGFEEKPQSEKELAELEKLQTQDKPTEPEPIETLSTEKPSDEAAPNKPYQAPASLPIDPPADESHVHVTSDVEEAATEIKETKDDAAHETEDAEVASENAEIASLLEKKSRKKGRLLKKDQARLTALEESAARRAEGRAASEVEDKAIKESIQSTTADIPAQESTEVDTTTQELQEARDVDVPQADEKPTAERTPDVSDAQSVGVSTQTGSKDSRQSTEEVEIKTSSEVPAPEKPEDSYDSIDTISAIEPLNASTQDETTEPPSGKKSKKKKRKSVSSTETEEAPDAELEQVEAPALVSEPEQLGQATTSTTEIHAITEVSQVPALEDTTTDGSSTDIKQTEVVASSDSAEPIVEAVGIEGQSEGTPASVTAEAEPEALSEKKSKKKKKKKKNASVDESEKQPEAEALPQEIAESVAKDLTSDDVKDVATQDASSSFFSKPEQGAADSTEVSLAEDRAASPLKPEEIATVPEVAPENDEQTRLADVEIPAETPPAQEPEKAAEAASTSDVVAAEQPPTEELATNAEDPDLAASAKLSKKEKKKKKKAEKKKAALEETLDPESDVAAQPEESEATSQPEATDIPIQNTTDPHDETSKHTETSEPPEGEAALEGELATPAYDANVPNAGDSGQLPSEEPASPEDERGGFSLSQSQTDQKKKAKDNDFEILQDPETNRPTEPEPNPDPGKQDVAAAAVDETKSLGSSEGMKQEEDKSMAGRHEFPVKPKKKLAPESEPGKEQREDDEEFAGLSKKQIKKLKKAKALAALESLAQAETSEGTRSFQEDRTRPTVETELESGPNSSTQVEPVAETPAEADDGPDTKIENEPILETEETVPIVEPDMEAESKSETEAQPLDNPDTQSVIEPPPTEPETDADVQTSRPESEQQTTFEQDIIVPEPDVESADQKRASERQLDTNVTVAQEAVKEPIAPLEHVLGSMEPVNELVEAGPGIEAEAEPSAIPKPPDVIDLPIEDLSSYLSKEDKKKKRDRTDVEPFREAEARPEPEPTQQTEELLSEATDKPASEHTTDNTLGRASPISESLIESATKLEPVAESIDSISGTEKAEPEDAPKAGNIALDAVEPNIEEVPASSSLVLATEEVVDQKPRDTEFSTNPLPSASITTEEPAELIDFKTEVNKLTEVAQEIQQADDEEHNQPAPSEFHENEDALVPETDVVPTPPLPPIKSGLGNDADGAAAGLSRADERKLEKGKTEDVKKPNNSNKPEAVDSPPNLAVLDDSVFFGHQPEPAKPVAETPHFGDDKKPTGSVSGRGENEFTSEEWQALGSKDRKNLKKRLKKKGLDLIIKDSFDTTIPDDEILPQPASEPEPAAKNVGVKADKDLNTVKRPKEPTERISQVPNSPEPISADARSALGTDPSVEAAAEQLETPDNVAGVSRNDESKVKETDTNAEDDLVDPVDIPRGNEVASTPKNDQATPEPQEPETASTVGSNALPEVESAIQQGPNSLLSDELQRPAEQPLPPVDHAGQDNTIQESVQQGASLSSVDSINASNPPEGSEIIENHERKLKNEIASAVIEAENLTRLTPPSTAKVIEEHRVKTREAVSTRTGNTPDAPTTMARETMGTSDHNVQDSSEPPPSWPVQEETSDIKSGVVDITTPRDDDRKNRKAKSIAANSAFIPETIDSPKEDAKLEQLSSESIPVADEPSFRQVDQRRQADSAIANEGDPGTRASREQYSDNSPTETGLGEEMEDKPGADVRHPGIGTCPSESVERSIKSPSRQVEAEDVASPPRSKNDKKKKQRGRSTEVSMTESMEPTEQADDVLADSPRVAAGEGTRTMMSTPADWPAHNIDQIRLDMPEVRKEFDHMQHPATGWEPDAVERTRGESLVSPPMKDEGNQGEQATIPSRRSTIDKDSTVYVEPNLLSAVDESSVNDTKALPVSPAMEPETSTHPSPILPWEPALGVEQEFPTGKLPEMEKKNKKKQKQAVDEQVERPREGLDDAEFGQIAVGVVGENDADSTKPTTTEDTIQVETDVSSTEQPAQPTKPLFGNLAEPNKPVTAIQQPGISIQTVPAKGVGSLSPTRESETATREVKTPQKRRSRQPMDNLVTESESVRRASAVEQTISGDGISQSEQNLAKAMHTGAESQETASQVPEQQVARDAGINDASSLTRKKREKGKKRKSQPEYAQLTAPPSEQVVNTALASAPQVDESVAMDIDTIASTEGVSTEPGSAPVTPTEEPIVKDAPHQMSSTDTATQECASEFIESAPFNDTADKVVYPVRGFTAPAAMELSDSVSTVKMSKKQKEKLQKQGQDKEVMKSAVAKKPPVSVERQARPTTLTEIVPEMSVELNPLQDPAAVLPADEKATPAGLESPPSTQPVDVVPTVPLERPAQSLVSAEPAGQRVGSQMEVEVRDREAVIQESQGGADKNREDDFWTGNHDLKHKGKGTTLNFEDKSRATDKMRSSKKSKDLASSENHVFSDMPGEDKRSERQEKNFRERTATRDFSSGSEGDRKETSRGPQQETSNVLESPILGQADLDLSRRPPQPLLLRRGSDIDEPMSGLLREDSRTFAPLAGTESELSDLRRSPSRLLESVPEVPETEVEPARDTFSTPDVKRDFVPVSDDSSFQRRSRRLSEEAQRDSGFEGEAPTKKRNKRLSQEPPRDSGVYTGDWIEKERQFQPAQERAVLHTPEATTERRLRRSPRGTPVLRGLPAAGPTPEPEKKERKQYGALTPAGAASAAIVAGAGTGLAAALQRPRPATPSPTPSPVSGQRSASDNAPTSRQSPSFFEGSGRRAVSNTSLSRRRTPEPLRLRPESPGIIRPSGTPTPPLRRVGKRMSSDLRALRQQNNTTTSSSTPVANEGRARAKEMADVYDGFGEGRIGSPRSPTRPHSMRRRQSMQVLELENKVEQLMAENRMLTDARAMAESSLSQRAVNSLAERDEEIDNLKQSLQFLQKEVSRLTEVNDGLASANAELANKDSGRVTDFESRQAVITRELDEARRAKSTSDKSLEAKDAEIADLRAKLDSAKEKIRDLQRQILETKADNDRFLNIRDEDHFDHRCQQLCSHVQQWVLRFSKFSDMRACRLTSEINDEKTIDRLDNAVLDGSDVDVYLRDRVKRRDIFMSMTMNMVWEFVFTRYLFGMDREQRQKLKSLEKLLTEVGPAEAVRQWRAVTLTLLAKRESFKRQRDLDTEAVVQAIFQTLCKILPPPSNLEDQIQSQLRRVMREAVGLSIEMRTQKAEYMMLPPLRPEYDADGELTATVQFNASMMNERSGSITTSNEDLEAQGAIVRVVLFPLVVKKGDDNGKGDEEIVVCPAQVLIPRSKQHLGGASDGGGTSLSARSHISIVTETLGPFEAESTI